MNISGKDIISRQTRATWRGIVFLSGSAVLVFQFDIDVSKLNILGVGLGNYFGVGSIVALFFLLVSHCVNLISDWVSSRPVFRMLLEQTSSERSFDDAGKTLTRLQHMDSKLSGLIQSGQYSSNADLLHEIKTMVVEFQKDVRSARVWFNFIFWMWNVSLPFFFQSMLFSCSLRRWET